MPVKTGMEGPVIATSQTECQATVELRTVILSLHVIKAFEHAQHLHPLAKSSQQGTAVSATVQQYRPWVRYPQLEVQ